MALTEFREYLRCAERKYRRPFWILYLYTAFVNLPILAMRLTNQYDGMWNQDDYYAGVWELSNGRWFWPFLDRGRFHLSLDPLPDLIAIGLFVGAFLILVSALSLKWNQFTWLAGFLFLASIGINCQLSYSFMSITFGFSALLAAAAVWIVAGAPEGESKSVDADRTYRADSTGHTERGRQSERTRHFAENAVRVILSGLLISVMMGCYQASLGITCLGALFAFMLQMTRGKRREGLRFALRMLCALLVGGALYLAFLHLCYRVFHGGPASYEGFDQITLPYILTHLPVGALHAYSTFRYTLFDNGFRVFRLEGRVWFPLLYLAVLLAGVPAAVQAFRRDRAGGILYLLSIALIPLFANSFYLLAPESEAHIQMIVPMTLVLPLLLCCAGEAGSSRPLQILWSGAAVFLIYCAVGQCVTDQYAMYVGRRSTEALADGILDVINSQNYDYVDGQVLILGNPSESRTFRVGEQFEEANDYAQYGRWTNTLSFNDQIWENFVHNYLRLEISFSEGDTEQTIADLPEVQAMPCYPAAGSIQYVYGVEVVKLSNAYYEAE